MPTTISGDTGVSAVQPNTVALADLTATGTPSASTYLRGDNSWATPPAGAENFSTLRLTGSGTYTPSVGAKSFFVFVCGATGGCSGTAGAGGSGGGGYAEKKYNAPFSTYSYAVGAGGNNTGTAGGTTTFDVISITGSGGTTTTAGAAGGAGSGGDFNATGGTGGTGRSAATAAGGGGGGAACRAGNGGNGGNAASGLGGGGGGTGGNNASGATKGAAATSEAVGVVVLPTNITGPITSYTSGQTVGGVDGGLGASAQMFINRTFPLINLDTENGGIGAGGSNNFGVIGLIRIIEVF